MEARDENRITIMLEPVGLFERCGAEEPGAKLGLGQADLGTKIEHVVCRIEPLWIQVGTIPVYSYLVKQSSFQDLGLSWYTFCHLLNIMRYFRCVATFLECDSTVSYPRLVVNG